MRIIKGYNDFITEANSLQDDKFGITDELESDVRDIFVELSDEGIGVDVQCWFDYKDKIWVTLSPIDSDSERDRFEVTSVKEYVMMLIDYMNMKYDVSAVEYEVCLGDLDSGDTTIYSFDKFPDDMRSLDTDEFGIAFKIREGINEGFGDFIGPDYDKIESDINDILVELVDDGFLTEISCIKGVILDRIYVDITKNDIYSDETLQHGDKIKVFSTADVKEDVMMLVDYMQDKFNNLETKFTLFTDDVYNPSEEGKHFTSYPDLRDVNGFCIEFRIIHMNNDINEGFGDFVGPEFDKIESDVNDMFIDLKDDGAKITIDFYHKGVGYGAGAEDYMIKVRIYSDRKFSMSDVEEPTRMMVDYFKDLTDKRVDMEYNMSSDYTNTRQREFNPYSFDNEVTIYLIERA